MFMQNKYSKWYFSIINRAVSDRKLDYYESHHIIPKCIGGTDDKPNLVNLTAKEHFVCHLLLTKMHSSLKLKFAVVMMLVSNEHHNRYKVNSRTYERIKRLNSVASKERMIGFIGHNLGRKTYHNPLTNEERFIVEGTKIPEGFILGMSPAKKKKVGDSNKGRIYYFNPDTKEVIHIKKHDTPPVGWIKGNPNANTSDKTNIRGSSYYYEPNTGEEVRSREEIPNWVKGRSLRWITNGFDNKQFNVIKYPIPDGWYIGRSTWR